MMTGLVLKGCRGVKMDWLVIRWGLDNVDVCQVHVRDGMGWGGGEAIPQEGEKGSSGVHRRDVEGRRNRTIIFVKHFRPHTEYGLKKHTVCRCRVIKRACVKFSFSLSFDLVLT